jgi:4-hydroxy-tetrahydrodipicolinate synthase
MGTSGEFARLDLGEWKAAVEVTIDEVRRKVPIYVGISDAGCRLVSKKADLAQSMNADVLVATPPYYFPVKQGEIYTFYKEIASNTSSPLMLYNIPSTTGVSIELETLIKLSKIKGIVGIKDSSGDIEALRKILSHFRGNDDFRVFVGEESIMMPGIREGSHGGVPSLGNVAPKLLVDLYEAAKGGLVEKAKKLEGAIFDINGVLNRCTDSWLAWLIGRKAALEIMGICRGKATAPSSALPEEALKKIEDKLREHGLIP